MFYNTEILPNSTNYHSKVPPKEQSRKPRYYRGTSVSVIPTSSWHTDFSDLPKTITWLLLLDSASTVVHNPPLSHHLNVSERPHQRVCVCVCGAGLTFAPLSRVSLHHCSIDWRGLRWRFTVYVSHTGATAHLESTREGGEVGGVGWNKCSTPRSMKGTTRISFHFQSLHFTRSVTGVLRSVWKHKCVKGYRSSPICFPW